MSKAKEILDMLAEAKSLKATVDKLVDDLVGLDAAYVVIKKGEAIDVTVKDSKTKRGATSRPDPRMKQEWEATAKQLIKELKIVGYEYKLSGATPYGFLIEKR